MTRANRRSRPDRPTLSSARLRALLDEALVDSYGDSEQAMALFTMMEEHLAVPFTTRILGVDAEVVGVGMTDEEEIVGLCRRGRERARISILDLSLPKPPPDGWEWIEAYRTWKRPRS
ncbi:MAG: hypothetical protein U0166_16250 [Acidobacteriota bacterium]